MSQQPSCPGCGFLSGDPTPSAPASCPACGQAWNSPTTAEPGWFYIRDKKKMGPVPLAELLRLAQTGGLQPADMILREGESRWGPAGAVAELFPSPSQEPTTARAPVDEGSTGPGGSPATQPTLTTTPRAEGQAPSNLPGVPGYEILRVLGRGGMGIVYQARQLQARRLVALKMIRPGSHAEGQQRARFHAEAEAVARLQHPNIVQIFEVGEHAAAPFFSLEYVDGGSLDARLRGTPMPSREAAALAESLAHAIEAAHQAGIIHRDLKPANILLTQSGVPKVTDFGLAKALDADSGQTAEGAIMGTPSYMAPEQAAGDLHAIGPRSDVYSLGAVLYECLTGRPPFRGASILETLEQVRTSEPVPPHALQPACPRDLETICLKCLQKEPSRRYESAAELAAELRRFQAGEPIRARPVGWLERGVKWARRRPAVAGLIGLVILVGLVGLTVSLWAWRNERQARQDADGRAEQERLAKEREAGALAVAQTANQKKEDALQAEKAALAKEQIAKKSLERQVYVSNVDLAARALESDAAAKAEEYLRLCPVALRGWEWYYLQRQCRPTPVMTLELRRFLGQTSDGRRLILACAADLEIADAETGREIQLVPRGLADYQQTCLSPDGRWLALWQTARDATNRRVLILDTATAKPVRSLVGTRSPVTAVAFSSDGKHLATCGGTGLPANAELKIWDLTTGRAVVDVKEMLGRGITSVCFGPDEGLPGRRPMLATGDFDGRVQLRDPASGRVLRILSGHENIVTTVVFSPDGQLLASGSADHTVRLWHPDDDKVVQVCRGHHDRLTALAFRPDGRRLASASADHTIRVWDTDGEEIAVFRNHQGVVERVAFTPDGSRLLSDDSLRLYVWDLLDPSDFLPAHSRALAFSPDGRRLATVTWQPAWDTSGPRPRAANRLAVRVQDRASGRVLQSMEFTATGLPIISLAFRSGSEELACTCGDRLVRVWDVTSGRLVRTVSMPAAAQEIRYSPDGTLLAVRAADQRVHVVDAITGREQFAQPFAGPLTHGLAFSPDGRQLAVAGNAMSEHVVTIVDVASHAPVVTLSGLDWQITDLAWVGTRLAGIGTSGSVKVWDTATGRDLFTFRLGETTIHGKVALTPDGQRLIAVGGHNLQMWELTEGQEVLSLKAELTAMIVDDALTFSPDGGFLAVPGLRSSVGRMKLLDGSRTALEASLCDRHEVGQRSTAALSADGKMLAGGSNRLAFWQMDTQQQVGSLPVPLNQELFTLAFSPDGRLLAGGTIVHSSSDRQPAVVHVWDAERRQLLLTFQQHTSAQAVVGAFAPDSRRIASGGQGQGKAPDHTIKIWDARTGQVELELTGHKSGITGLAFSPDGSRLASTSRDKTLRVWDTRTGRQLFACRGPEANDFFTDVAFTPDGTQIVTAGATVIVWDATGKLVRTAKDPPPLCMQLALSRDGKLLAAGGQGLVVWDFPSGRELLRHPTTSAEAIGLAFTPDGSRLIVGTGLNVNVWDVSGERLAREEARRRDAPQRLRAWHQLLAESYHDRKRWFAARFHYSWQLAADPEDVSASFHRALDNAELGRWDEAAADLARLPSKPDEVGLPYFRFLLALRAGKQETCRDIRAHLWQHRSSAQSPNDEALVAWAHCLTPGVPIDPKEVVKVAEHAVAREAAEPHLRVLGAALCRAGQPNDAVKRLRESIQLHPLGGDPQSWLFLAMAYQALGQRDEARNALNQAVVQKNEKAKDSLDWRDRLESDVLQSEVLKLLGEQKP